jgi:hypothetical protein
MLRFMPMKKLYSQNWSQPVKCQSSNADQEVTKKNFIAV